jgi:hypothetical protein
MAAGEAAQVEVPSGAEFRRGFMVQRWWLGGISVLLTPLVTGRMPLLSWTAPQWGGGGSPVFSAGLSSRVTHDSQAVEIMQHSLQVGGEPLHSTPGIKASGRRAGRGFPIQQGFDKEAIRAATGNHFI